jgi:hypothetical protein
VSLIGSLNLKYSSKYFGSLNSIRDFHFHLLKRHWVKIVLSECDIWILRHYHRIKLFLKLKLLSVSFSRSEKTISSKNLDLLSLELLACLSKTSVSYDWTFWITSGREKPIHVLTDHLVWIMDMINVLSKLELTFDVSSRSALEFLWVLMVVRWTQTALLFHWDSPHNHLVHSRFIVILTEACIHLSHKRSWSNCWIPYILHLLRCTENGILKHGIRFIYKHILSPCPVKLWGSSHFNKIFPQVFTRAILECANPIFIDSCKINRR